MRAHVKICWVCLWEISLLYGKVQILYLFLGFPTKNHCQTSVLKLEETSENNRYRWLNKNNRTDCDGKNVQKPSTSHRCYIKNIGIASLSKIDHRSSLLHAVWTSLTSASLLQSLFPYQEGPLQLSQLKLLGDVHDVLLLAVFCSVIRVITRD